MGEIGFYCWCVGHEFWLLRSQERGLSVGQQKQQDFRQESRQQHSAAAQAAWEASAKSARCAPRVAIDPGQGIDLAIRDAAAPAFASAGSLNR